MQLTDILLKNFKGIENLSVCFKPGVNLIIGNNGAGKTSLLSGIGIAICNVISWLPVGFRGIRQEDIFVTSENTGDATTNLKYHTPVTIEAKFNYANKTYNSKITRRSESSNSETKDYDMLRLMKEKVGNNQELPLLSYLNSGRTSRIEYSGNRQIQLKQGKVDRLTGYRSAFDEVLNFNDIGDWCLRMDFAEYQMKKEVKEYSMFKNTVASFISHLQNNVINPHVYYSSSWGSLVYVENGQETPFYNLSSGFQNVLCMAMELAYRAAVLNPELKDVEDVQGIVLIDEIEMHLHPAWQWKIVGALQKTFPKVQFIIATHSPIILSSAKDATIFLMKSVNEIKVLDNAFGYKINDVLELRQGSTDVPEEIAAYYDKIEKLLDPYDENKLAEIQKEITDKYGEDSYVAKSIHDFIKINTWIEEA